MMTKEMDTEFNLARRVFYRIWLLAYKAQEHGQKAEEAGDYEKADAAFIAFKTLRRQAAEAYLRMKKLDTEGPRPSIIDVDVVLEEDLRMVFPEVFAADEREGYGDWRTPDEDSK